MIIQQEQELNGKKKLFRSPSEDTQHVFPWHMNRLSWHVMLNGCGFCFSDSGTGYKNHPLFLDEEWSANRLPKPHLQWIASLGDFHFAQLHLGACAQARRGVYCMYFSLTLEIKRVDFFSYSP